MPGPYGTGTSTKNPGKHGIVLSANTRTPQPRINMAKAD
jgi:hypothetical protein